MSPRPQLATGGSYAPQQRTPHQAPISQPRKENRTPQPRTTTPRRNPTVIIHLDSITADDKPDTRNYTRLYFLLFINHDPKIIAVRTMQYGLN